MGTAFGSLAASKDVHERDVRVYKEMLFDNYEMFESAKKAKNKREARAAAIAVMVISGMLSTSYAGAHYRPGRDEDEEDFYPTYESGADSDKSRISRYVKAAKAYLMSGD